MILSSHILAEVQEICDDILIISKGKLIAEGSPDELEELTHGKETIELTILANEIFNNYEKYSGVSIWVGAAAFTMQLYTDFDGCMDIVLGISECFGIRLPENFSAPFYREASRNTGEDGISAGRLAEKLFVLSAASDEVFHESSQES